MDNKDEVQAHPNCKCIYVPMRTKTVGTATNMGYNGADAQIFYLNKLPDYYVSKNTAYAAGWKTKHKRLDDVLPGKMIIITMTLNFRLHLEEFGTKLILITKVAKEIANESCIQMMD